MKGNEMRRREFLEKGVVTILAGSALVVRIVPSLLATESASYRGKFLEDTLRKMPRGTIANLVGIGFKDEAEAAVADVGWPMGIVRNPIGEMIVAEYHGNRIWRIDRRGI